MYKFKTMKYSTLIIVKILFTNLLKRLTIYKYNYK